MNYIIYSDSCNYHDLHSQITQVAEVLSLASFLMVSTAY